MIVLDRSRRKDRERSECVDAEPLPTTNCKKPKYVKNFSYEQAINSKMRGRRRDSDVRQNTSVGSFGGLKNEGSCL